MRIRVLVLVALSPFLTNCPTCCFPPKEQFAVNTTVSVESLSELIERVGPYRPERRLTCEDLCKHVYMTERKWYLHRLDSCSHRFTTPDERALGAAAASVSCRGVGIAYYCR